LPRNGSLWNKGLNGRLSRRRLLTGATALAAGAGAYALAGCGGGDEETAGTPGASPQAEGTPKKGGQRELSYFSGWNIDPQLDFNMGAMVSFRVYSHMFYERMDTGETVLLAARSLEQPDEVTYVFTLRDDMHFQDTPDIASTYPGLAGRLVTSEDVKYAIERQRTVAGAPARDYALNRLDRVEVPDQLTVRIVNKGPFSWTLSSLSLGSPLCAPIIAHEVVEKAGDLKTVAVGSGPFLLDYANQTQGVRFVRNPGYFVPDEPFIDSERWRIVNDPETGEAAFRSGEIDTYVADNRPRADSLKDLPGTFQVLDADLRWAMFGVNTRKPPFNDARVVEALHYAIDRDAMILSLEGGRSGDDPQEYGRWCSGLPWGLEFYSLSQEELRGLYPPLDLQKARDLLSAAGHDSVDVSLKHINIGKHPQLAQMIATQLREVGINARLEPLDTPTFISKVPLQFDFEMNSRYQVNATSPEQPLRIYLTTGGQGLGSEWGLTDTDIDAAFEDVARTFPLAERREKVQEMQRLIIRKNVPVINLYAPFLYTQYYDFIKDNQAGTGQAVYFNYRLWLDK